MAGGFGSDESTAAEHAWAADSLIAFGSSLAAERPTVRRLKRRAQAAFMKLAPRGSAERLALLSCLGVTVLVLLGTAFSLDEKGNWLEGIHAIVFGTKAVIPNLFVAVIPVLDAGLVLASRTRFATVAVALLALLLALAVVPGLLLLGLLGMNHPKWTEISYLLAMICLVILVQWLSLRGALQNARLRGRN